jgi:hypothetical protein
LIAKRIPVNEVLKPTDLIILEDYFVFSNEYITGEDCFYVYSKEDFRFCYSFGRLGRGAREFIAPRFVYHTTGNVCAIYDSAYDKITTYELSAEGVDFIGEDNIVKIEMPIQGISYHNDSTLLFRVFLPPMEGVELYSYDLQKDVVLDTLRFDTRIKEMMGANYNPSLDDFAFDNYADKFVIVFNYINQVVIGDVNHDGTFGTTTYQYQSTSIVKKLRDNMVYYLFPVATKERVYAQYYGRPFQQMQPFPINLSERNFDFLIEVYDWDKKPLRRLHLDSDILRFRIDERTNKLYAWSMLSDFDYLLEYDLN